MSKLQVNELEHPSPGSLLTLRKPARPDDAAAPNELIRLSQLQSYAAPVAGSASQPFSVAPPATSDQAVPLGHLGTAGATLFAPLEGSGTQAFSVAAATLVSHAVRLGQFAAAAGSSSLTLELPALGLPGGATRIIIQVGYLPSRPSIASTHAYNTPFPNQCFGVWFTEVFSAQHNDNPKLNTAPGLSTFTMHSDAPSNPIYWIAVGY